ncbi:hypothetical protein AFLA_004119 [Aspergillus flavus NRRL3357]|nr:hypothetical protein AFLA_004119 [Aspergillus flavus NRRL3357]
MLKSLYLVLNSPHLRLVKFLLLFCNPLLLLHHFLIGNLKLMGDFTILFHPKSFLELCILLAPVCSKLFPAFNSRRISNSTGGYLSKL